MLINQNGGTVDARFLRDGEQIVEGCMFQFPCHFARVDGLIRRSGPPASSGDSGGVAPCPRMHVDRSKRHGGAGILGSSPAGPACPAIAADESHVAMHPTVR